ncbi:MAG: hypothetical protein EKK39_02185 [Sphingobacteriales bacterium]|uniref:hypothetical protein n=1 Tax=Hydrotalea flava TaxID=714549 RepID=UPI00082A4909|nr:hypothetical protein [Hydrotalea flava]RTL55842.1 MAG: hypothetical protein EKK39_02185 [Sphingobacteriales bacterium]
MLINQPNSKKTYLPIRAFGDFVISASIISKGTYQRIPIILPNYLSELFYELNCTKYFYIERVIPMNEYHKLFQLYKIKSLSDIINLKHEIKIIKKCLLKEDTYLLDFRSKRLSVILPGYNFIYPGIYRNIYIEKNDLFSDFSLNTFNSSYRISYLNKKIHSIYIFPGSRQGYKVIHPKLLKELVKFFSSLNLKVKVFIHINENFDFSEAIKFKNFQELTVIISECEFMISADSLPVHLAYYFDKPHFVIFNTSPNTNWITPYMTLFDAFATYNGNINAILSSIKLYIKKYFNNEDSDK